MPLVYPEPPGKLGSGKESRFFMPCPQVLRLLYTMQILALLNTDVGLHVVSTIYCIYCELTGPGLPLADFVCVVKPAEGSLPGKVPPLHSEQGLEQARPVSF